MLRKKLLRDIKNNASQFITIFLMILIGVMVYTGITAYMGGMQETADKFYLENNLFDLQVMGKLNKDDINKIKSFANVNDVEGKLSVSATSNDDKVLLLNFIESNNISKFYVLDGEGFDVNKKGVWLDNFYAKENNIKVGDTISIKYDNFSLTEKVLGLINVPDHVYDTKDEAELYPNRLDFGFAYLSTHELENYINQKVSSSLNIEENLLSTYIKDYNYENYLEFNYLMVDTNSNRDEVKKEIESNINNSLAVVERENITSYATYQGEIDEGKTYVGVFSGLFIFIAMLSVITTMTRVIKKERREIGTLKALGFSNFKILIHYMSYGFYIALLGVIFGILIGYFGIGNIFINLEMSFFEIPNGKPILDLRSFIVALIVIILVLFITYLTSKSILKESPADTLKPKIPNVKKGSLNFTKKKIFRRTKFSTIWNIRDILRNKTRTFMGLSGVIGCTMLIVCALGMLDSMNHFIKLQFDDLYNFAYKLTLKEDIDATTLNNLEKEYTYSSKTYAIEIIENDKKVLNNLVVTDASDKLRFVDKKENFIKINSKDGVYVTYKYAKNNNLKVGDEI